MDIHPLVRNLFGRFQNLNLLVLREDLRRGLTVQGDWILDGQLCPLAHGLTDGEVVQQLRKVSVNLEDTCRVAARYLGAEPIDVFRFVRLWDENGFGQSWLLKKIETLWDERLTDAEAMQAVLIDKEWMFCDKIEMNFSPLAGNL